MAEELALELVDKRLVTDQIVLTVGYEKRLDGSLPKQAHGSLNLNGVYLFVQTDRAGVAGII